MGRDEQWLALKWPPYFCCFIVVLVMLPGYLCLWNSLCLTSETSGFAVESGLALLWNTVRWLVTGLGNVLALCAMRFSGHCKKICGRCIFLAVYYEFLNLWNPLSWKVGIVRKSRMWILLLPWYCYISGFCFFCSLRYFWCAWRTGLVSWNWKTLVECGVPVWCYEIGKPQWNGLPVFYLFKLSGYWFL